MKDVQGSQHKVDVGLSGTPIQNHGGTGARNGVHEAKKRGKLLKDPCNTSVHLPRVNAARKQRDTVAGRVASTIPARLPASTRRVATVRCVDAHNMQEHKRKRAANDHGDRSEREVGRCGFGQHWAASIGLKAVRLLMGAGLWALCLALLALPWCASGLICVKSRCLLPVSTADFASCRLAQGQFRKQRVDPTQQTELRRLPVAPSCTQPHCLVYYNPM